MNLFQHGLDKSGSEGFPSLVVMAALAVWSFDSSNDCPFKLDIGIVIEGHREI